MFQSCRTLLSCWEAVRSHVGDGAYQCPYLESNEPLSELLDQALKIFGSNKCYTPEKGRAALLKSTVLRQQGQIESSQASLGQARSLFEAIGKNSNSNMNLSLTDFEKYVHVWGR